MMPNLPERYGGGEGRHLGRYNHRRIDRQIERYQQEAFAATIYEGIDQVASYECHQHNILATGELLDFAVALAGDDPAKQQLYAMSVLNFTTGNLARINRRFGGVR